MPSGTIELILVLASTIGRLSGPIGLKPADLPGAVAGHGGDHLAMLIEDRDCGLGKLDGDCLASMAEADLDALARDLDAAAAV